MMRWILFSICVCWTSIGYSTDYYVGGAGASDSNQGTSSQPFATIQKAANVAKGGDVVIIRAGLYRETITPANSGSAATPITFRAENGASVTISGLNVIDNGAWTNHSGQIFKASIGLPAIGFPSGMDITNNTTLLAHQIFKDGDMMIEARWPKGVAQYTDLLTLSAEGTNGTRRFISQFGTGVFEPGYLQDNGLLQANGFPLPSGGLVGATVVVTGWFITESRTITAHSGNQINFSNIWNTGPADKAGERIRKYYFLTHKLAFLTQQREWHYEGGVLYFWQPNGGNPTNVEYKARNWGFDLRGKSGIVIQGLTFKGCEVATGNTSTSYCTIDNIRASFMNHTVRLDRSYWQGYGTSQLTGTKLLGPGNVFKNSEMKWAASQGVWIGAGGKVENNKFEYFGYDGMWGCPVSFWGMDNVSNIVVTRNTMAHTGRGAIDNGFAFVEGQVRNTTNNEISYNDMYDFSRLNQDGGAFYSWGYQNLAGDRFHHNWIHDLGAVKPPDGSMTDGILAGIYFDMGSGGLPGQTPVTVDHNVFWNNAHTPGWTNYEFADLYTLPVLNYSTKQPARIFNNTFWGNQKAYVTYQSTVVDVMRNNISRGELNFNWGRAASNISNSLNGGNLQFVGSGAGGLAYRIQATSPARDAGVAIPGITDGSVGTPDIGAYEYGGDAWVAGYTPVATPPASNTPPVVTLTAPANNASINQGTAINLTANATDNGSVTKVEFYDGNTKIGEDITSPYSFTWNGASAGTHSLTARATDNQNTTATSAVITITITGTNPPPTISITAPANNAQFTAAANVTITVTAADANGTISKVEFFDGATKLGEDTSSPYSFAWNNVKVGSHALTARATDNQNAATTSATVTVTVVAAAANAAPTVSITAPANNAQLITGANVTIAATAADANGTISKVEFFNGATKLGEDTSSPYSFAWNNITTGTHRLTAKATDNQGSVTTSAIVTVTASAAIIDPANVPPTVFITSPVSGTDFSVGTIINIAADASDSDGTIANVEFYQGAIKLGEDASLPYEFVWNDAAAGTFLLVAIATDNDGAFVTSSAVEVTVTDPFSPGEEEVSGIPRFFSPNEDGTGDTWVWATDEVYANAAVSVFNRAGQQVYASASYDNSWDGKSGGQALQDGDYYYVIKLANQTDIKGSVRIIR